ncbi:MAG: hypothetical protein ACYTEZ_01585 [Planctomycetota bacterium]
MRQRSDPLVPLLAAAVAVVVVGAIGLIFYPRLSRWLGPDRAFVVGAPPSPTATVPVWICRTEDGVALMLEAGSDAGTAETLDRALEDGPYRYLRLSVYNFGRPHAFALELPQAGFTSPEGGAPALPAAARLRADVADHLRAVLRGLGAVARLDVAQGRTGHALLVTKQDPERRTAFVSGALRFERKEVQRRVLASWQRRPDWEKFKNL